MLLRRPRLDAQGLCYRGWQQDAVPMRLSQHEGRAMTPERLAELKSNRTERYGCFLTQVEVDELLATVDALLAQVADLQSTVDVLTAAVTDLRLESSAYRRGVEDGVVQGRLRWSRERPRTAGWYCHRRPGHILDFDVIWIHGPRGLPRNYGGEWAGPIPPPEEAR